MSKRAFRDIEETDDNHFIKVVTTTVKQGLLGNINAKLKPKIRENFLTYIHTSSDLVGRLTRRASLIFLYYVTSTLKEGRDVPDFEEFNSNYWNKWIKIGIGKFKSPMPNEEVRKYYEEKAASFNIDAPNGLPWGIKPPKYFDAVLSYAAITFKTCVINAYKVHMFDTLQRACSIYKDDNASKLTIYNALMNGVEVESLSPEAKSFVERVRSVLQIADNETIYEDTEFPIPVRANLLWLLQREFVANDRRRIMLAPLFKVQRPHIHLDMKTLINMATVINKEVHQEEAAMLKAKQVELNPIVEEMPLRYDEILKEYGCDDPVKKLAKLFPNPKCPTRPRQTSPEEWKVIKDRHEKDMEAIEELRKEHRESPEFIQELEAYRRFRQIQEDAALSFFALKRHKGPQWKLIPGVDTDGVSISFKYQKQDVKERQPKGSKKQKKAKEQKICNSYNADADTIVKNTLVLGVDPGRTSLVAAVAVVDGFEYRWKYTRSNFYHDAKIFKHNIKTRKWDTMTEKYKEMQALGAEYKTDDCDKLVKYIEWNRRVETEWWEDRLQNKWTRARFGQYIFKRQAVDNFTSELKKDLQVLADRMNIEIAYGHCGPRMKPNGKGELSVPTTGMFKAFRRTFGTANTFLTNEFNTTKVSWTTGESKERVYTIPRIDKSGKLRLDLFHTNFRYMPRVKPAEREAFERDRLRIHYDKARRKGGKAAELPPTSNPEEQRHSEIRGVRFCTKTLMYLDRDYTAARAIAGLRCLEIEEKGRPAAFLPQKKKPTDPGESNICEEPMSSNICDNEPTGR